LATVKLGDLERGANAVLGMPALPAGHFYQRLHSVCWGRFSRPEERFWPGVTNGMR
jgi:hypothetical protein